nr:hypothetical protein Ade03nite_24190 [Actinoplanes derwentensis]
MCNAISIIAVAFESSSGLPLGGPFRESVIRRPPRRPDFTALSGVDCATANPLVTIRNPAALDSWTQPVLELLMVAGAIAALVHAVLWWRRRGDASNLGLWLAIVVYVLILEPPLYFPDWFGLDDQVGLIFVHNVFTVQFLFDRLRCTSSRSTRR